MSKAEQRALEVYPPKLATYSDLFGEETLDDNGLKRAVFIEGYYQAEKDLELTWKDMSFMRLAFDATEANIHLGAIKVNPMTKEYYQEVLKRFKELKK